MPGTVYRSAVLAAAVAAAGCGGSRRVVVEIPPRMDLRQYGAVALTTFTVEKAKGTLHELATSRFSEEVLHAQPGVEVIEMGSVDSIVRRAGEGRFASASAQALGVSRNVPAVFVGHLKVSDVKPAGRLLGLNLPSIEATVQVEMEVALYSTRSGGTLWRSSAIATEKVAQLGLVGGEPHFSAKDPNAAYGRLVDRLVDIVTRDFRPSYREERHRR